MREETSDRVLTSRVLPPAEADRLVGTDAELLAPALQAGTAMVWVVEDGDEVVGTVAALPMVVMECCWVTPARRGAPGITRRLLDGMREMTTALGHDRMVTLPGDERVARIVVKLGGTVLPAPAVVVPVRRA